MNPLIKGILWGIPFSAALWLLLALTLF